jgi:hypothetical protein
MRSVRACEGENAACAARSWRARSDGKALPKLDLDRIKTRLRMAQEYYEKNYRVKKTG